MADLLTLSRGPMKYVTRFKGYIINGYRFHVQDYDKGLRTQNYGIVVTGETDEEDKTVDYIGELTNILELQFIGGRRLILFRCMWFDVYDNERQVKMDEYDFQSFFPPGALARGRGQSVKSMGSVKVTAEKRNLIDQTDITLETMRSKSEKEIGHNFTSGGFVKESIVRGRVKKRTMVGNNKGLNSATYTQNVIAQKINVVPLGFDALEDETFFSNDDLEVMQEAVTSKQAHNKNLMQPGFDRIKVDTFFPRDDLEVMGRGNRFTSLSSIRGGIEKRIMIGNNKGLNSATYIQNVVAQKINVVPPGFDALEDETSFPNDDLEVMQETRTSIGKSKNYCVPSSDENELAHNKNLMQPGLDPIEVDTFFPHDDLEVMGRGSKFTSPSSLRGGIGKRIMIRNNKGLNFVIYDQNVIPKKTNVVCPDFDAIEVETSFPHDNHEVMQENMRSKPGKEKRKNITSVGSARGSTFVQRTPIGKRKGYSVVSSDMNVQPHNKIIRQPNFNPIEHDTSFPHDDEAMQKALRSKSARERAQIFTYVGSSRRCAEKRTLNGKIKDSRNSEYDLNEVTLDDITLPQDEFEVMQDTRRSKAGSLVRDRNMCPLRVHSWTDIEEAKLEHMWGAITSKPLQEVLQDVPEGVDKSDWKWLVKEHFLSEKFKEKSTRNAMNLFKLSMPHRTGSKPIREIIYELGGKQGNPPDMATIFFETRKKDNKFLEPETNKKYEEIQELLQVEPSPTNIEVVERCFGPQSKSHVVGFGGGITRKDLKGGSSAKVALLEQLNVNRKEKVALIEELNASRKENESIKRRMDNIEKRCEIFESAIFRDPLSPPSSREQNTS
ncbi:hypothetical protein KY284_022297 [Solanum tuberosum]|nr:hypothetical protein KY284_022297 [Solanum tuberosum]